AVRAALALFDISAACSPAGFFPPWRKKRLYNNLLTFSVLPPLCGFPYKNSDDSPCEQAIWRRLSGFLGICEFPEVE
ncbi:MAG TPA: hypothetical protein VLS90_12110, partial [Thermodesulfobacteriota bacterium]|nr:hypothetical protein [Thermodesulfobacteriota bacterium]